MAFRHHHAAEAGWSACRLKRITACERVYNLLRHLWKCVPCACKGREGMYSVLWCVWVTPLPNDRASPPIRGVILTASAHVRPPLCARGTLVLRVREHTWLTRRRMPLGSRDLLIMCEWEWGGKLSCCWDTFGFIFIASFIGIKTFKLSPLSPAACKGTDGCNTARWTVVNRHPQFPPQTTPIRNKAGFQVPE